MARSLNKATIIGNLTRDPELRYTPQGTAVCSFTVATNRQWRTDSGDIKDEAEFHRVVAWDKLAEICSQLLAKGKRVFIEGRLQTRRWTGQDGHERKDIEIVASDMILLDRRGESPAESIPTKPAPAEEIDVPADLGEGKKEVVKEEKNEKAKKKDIPF